ncbi:MAG: peptide chain release factor N(5)-glutamine methyltransferase [Spirochaetes bacterium]|nr:peptide chain release factor N(5)-glutamine methyltransferase [Spirochaetota bacterium]
MLLSSLYQKISNRFKTLSHIDQPQVDAKILICHILKLDLAEFITRLANLEVKQEDMNKIETLVLKREQGKSVASIIGQKAFYDLALSVNDEVLIPRPETEVLIEAILQNQNINELKCALDIGAGSGAITLTLAQHLPKLTIDALEKSPDACKVIHTNLDKYPELKKQIRIINQDFFIFQPDQIYDLIVSNPPYTPTAQTILLKENKIIDDPLMALDGGLDGLQFYRKITQFVNQFLKVGGWLALEHGFDQQKQIIELFSANNYEIQTLKDLSSQDRGLLLQKKR